MGFTQCGGGRVARKFSRSRHGCRCTGYSPVIANEISVISCPGDMERVASIKKDTEEKNSFGRKKGERGPEQTSPQLDGGAAVCSGSRRACDL